MNLEFHFYLKKTAISSDIKFDNVLCHELEKKYKFIVNLFDIYKSKRKNKVRCVIIYPGPPEVVKLF